MNSTTDRINWPKRAADVQVPDGRIGSVVGYDTNPNRVLVRFSDHGRVETIWIRVEDAKVR